jgi:hypothetical protein
MNLEDLMEVWRSQDAAPLHGVNETLLRLALRQDDAMLRARLRRQKRINYGAYALCGGIWLFFLLFLLTSQVKDVSGWDYAIAIGGLAVTLILARRAYVAYRTQARREQGFSESLRDQISRQIALLDTWMLNPWRTGAARAKTLTTFLLGVILWASLGFISARVNGHNPKGEALRSAVGTVFVALATGWVGGLLLRRWNRRIGAPRKRRLEALLKEFDG